MSPSGKVLYRHGNYGNTVKVVQRDRGTLVLRYTKAGGGETDKALGHHDLRRAQQQARELSRQLSEVRASESGAPGARDGMTVQELFARYAVTVSAHKKGTQPTEDERRRVLWLAFFANGVAGMPSRRKRVKTAPEGKVALAFGPTLRASAVTPAHVKLFIAARSAGTIAVEGLKLKKVVKPRTVDADVVWLLSVYNWAYNEARLLKVNPLRGTKRPDVVTQLRPMATPERVAKLEAVAAQVHPRFPLLLACARYLGWRISAICALRNANFDRHKTAQAPYGRVRKDWETDKEGVAQWLPMPKPLRDALDDAKLVGNALLFPSPKVPKKPMSRSYARDLLERAEKLAKLKALDGGDWHPYRRLWATQRKSLPTGDVMLAGGWQDERTVRKYQLADPETIKQVMLFDPTETQTSPASGATSGTPKPKTQRRGGRVSA